MQWTFDDGGFLVKTPIFIWVCFISVEATIKCCRTLRAEPTQMKHTLFIFSYHRYVNTHLSAILETVHQISGGFVPLDREFGAITWSGWPKSTLCLLAFNPAARNAGSTALT